MPHALRITWTERERGWGLRPDGATLHQSREHAVDYIEHNYNAKVRENLERNYIPDEYSSPDYAGDDPAVPLVEVSDEVWQKIIDNGGTAWE